MCTKEEEEMGRAPENLWSSVLEGAGVFSGSIGSCFGLSSAKRGLNMWLFFLCDIISTKQWDVSMSLFDKFY